MTPIVNTSWFEMKEYRKRRYNNSVWVPLRLSETIAKHEEPRRVGTFEEYVGCGSVMVPLAKRSDAEGLHWTDIGLSHNSRAWAVSNYYKPAEIYQSQDKVDLGVDLVLDQYFDFIPRQWHLNQDLVVALELLQEGDNWVKPSEGYKTIVRLRRGRDGRPIAIEILNEYLRDYLCARGCLLKLCYYRSRCASLANLSDLEDLKPREETEGNLRYELRSWPVDSQGMGLGSAVVMRVHRNDIDGEEDVPVAGQESDENTDYERTEFGPKRLDHYKVEGEIWGEEYIEPSDLSAIVRRDKSPSGLSFVVEASGQKLSSEQLNNEDIGRWLWFKPTVVMELMKIRGSSFSWYTAQTGGISCGSDLLTHFGINQDGLLNVYAYDIAKLDHWQQKIWFGFSVPPQGGVCKELLKAQMEAQVSNTEAPEIILEKLLNKLNPLFEVALGKKLLKEKDTEIARPLAISRFRGLEADGLFALAKEITRRFVERIDVTILQEVVPLVKGEKRGSLKSLERYLATIVTPGEASKLMAVLFAVYDMRLADAHDIADNTEDLLKRIGISDDESSLDKAYLLIEAVAKAIWRIGHTVDRSVVEKPTRAEPQ